MAWQNFWRTNTESSSSSSVSSATKPRNRSSLEKPRLDSNMIIKLHYKETTYRIRFNLSEGHQKLRRRIMVKLNFPENEATLVYGYVDVDFNLICINNTEDLLGCKEYTESHYNNEYIRLVVYDSKDSNASILREYKNMETVRKGDLAVAERTRIPQQPAYSLAQSGKGEFNEPQTSLHLVTIIEDDATPHEIDYELKNGYSNLWKFVAKNFGKTDSHHLAYFDRYSSLTAIQDQADLNESYHWMYDNKNINLYYFPDKHSRRAYQYHYHEINKRRMEQKRIGEKSDLLSPPDYSSLQDLHINAKEEQGVRYFKIRFSNEVPYYSFFKYNPHNGILVFRDILREKARRSIKEILGYFDDDMDLITIDTDEDLLECAHAIRGPIICFEMVGSQLLRKVNRLWSEEQMKLQEEEHSNWHSGV